MADLWVTIPSAGRATLTAAIDSTGVDRDHIVIVDTSGTVQADGCHVVRDDGPINIQRWWRQGIDYAQALGATHVAVLNDDVELGHNALRDLLWGLQATGAAIASPGPPNHVTDPSKGRGRTINGACWVLDLATGLRPDERYRWWFGDDDLDWRARRDHGGVIALPIPYTHLRPNGYTSDNPALQALAAQDATRWAQQRAAA